MKVVALRKNPDIYTCNAYFVTGDFKTLQDVNALVDVGSDDYIIKEIESIYTGVGKKPVERVVITHEHFDHCAGLKSIVDAYAPDVLGFSTSGVCPCKPLTDGESVRLGDRDFLVIHAPGHSGDSICLYCEEEKAIFTGDTPIHICTKDATYGEEFILALEKLARLDLKIAFTGHDGIIKDGLKEMLHETLKNVSTRG